MLSHLQTLVGPAGANLYVGEVSQVSVLHDGRPPIAPVASDALEPYDRFRCAARQSVSVRSEGSDGTGGIRKPGVVARTDDARDCLCNALMVTEFQVHRGDSPASMQYAVRIGQYFRASQGLLRHC